MTDQRRLSLACPTHGAGHRRRLLYQDTRCECGRALEPDCDNCDPATCWCARAGLLDDGPVGADNESTGRGRNEA